MFQKSCLFKCIQSNKNYNQNSFIEQSQIDFITTSSSSSGSSNDGTKNQWATIKRKINNSIISGIKMRKKIVKNKKKIKIASKTTQIKTRTAFANKDYVYYDFENTDDDSDISFDPLSYYRDNDNLNSSLSSVSSLEFEPFESVLINEKTKSYTNTITRKFEPISTSSRSNILNLVNNKSSPPHTKPSNFRPFTTSSRRSLLSNINESRTHREMVSCSICCAVNEENLHQQEKCRSNFSFERSENICSSTLISISNQNSKIKNYEPCLINFPNITNNYSLLTSSSSLSASSNGSFESTTDLTNLYFCKNEN